MVVDAFFYMYVLGLGASLGVLTSVLVGLKIYNRKGKASNNRNNNRNVIG